MSRTGFLKKVNMVQRQKDDPFKSLIKIAVKFIIDIFTQDCINPGT